MSTSVQGLNIHQLIATLPIATSEAYKATYEAHCDRVYSLAFYMTDNEMAAEEIAGRTFLRVFAASAEPSAEQIDRALVNELRADEMNIGELSLEASAVTEILNARRNVKRAILERAVVALPATERIIFLMHDVEGYSHNKIARILGISETDSISGLNAARLRVRELVSEIR